MAGWARFLCPRGSYLALTLLLGLLRVSFFFHGLGRLFLGLFLTVHAFTHGFRSLIYTSYEE